MPNRRYMGATMTHSSASGSLRGLPAELVVSDPWELVGENGSAHFEVEIVNVDTHADGAERERALVRLQTPVIWQDRHFRHLVVQDRHGHGIVDELLAGRPVECSALGVTDEQAAGESPWGADKWRGGLAAIGRLTVQQPGSF
jgi:hypothetical protein